MKQAIDPQCAAVKSLLPVDPVQSSTDYPEGQPLRDNQERHGAFSYWVGIVSIATKLDGIHRRLDHRRLEGRG